MRRMRVASGTREWWIAEKSFVRMLTTPEPSTLLHPEGLHPRLAGLMLIQDQLAAVLDVRVLGVETWPDLSILFEEEGGLYILPVGEMAWDKEFVEIYDNLDQEEGSGEAAEMDSAGPAREIMYFE